MNGTVLSPLDFPCREPHSVLAASLQAKRNVIVYYIKIEESNPMFLRVFRIPFNPSALLLGCVIGMLHCRDLFEGGHF